MRLPPLPQFGLLTLFAAMLLVAGGAGWYRHELALHREEQAILEELAEANCITSFEREAEDAETVLRRQKEGFAWYEPEWILRIAEMEIAGNPSEDLRRRIAALPALKRLRISPASSRPTFPPSSEIAGIEFPEFRAGELSDDRIAESLPEGEPIVGEERERALAAIARAWESASDRQPSRFIHRYRVREADSAYPYARPDIDVDLVRDGDRFWSVQNYGEPDPGSEASFLALGGGPQGDFALQYDAPAWRLAWRSDPGIPRAAMFPRTFRQLELDLPRSKDSVIPHDWILSRVKRLARIDADRIRLDVKPGKLDLSGPWFSRQVYEVDELSLVLREDLDWAVCSERSITRDLNAMINAGWSVTRRSERTFDRHDGYVLPTEELNATAMTQGIYPGIELAARRTLHAWTIEPNLDSSMFAPERYLAEPLPPRTAPSPWHFVTLALGGALSLYLIVRRLAAAAHRRRPASVSGIAAAERAPPERP